MSKTQALAGSQQPFRVQRAGLIVSPIMADAAHMRNLPAVHVAARTGTQALRAFLER